MKTIIKPVHLAVLGFFCVVLFFSLYLLLNTTSQKLPKQPQPTQPARVTPTPQERVPRQVIVKFKSIYTDAQINEHLKMYNASIIKKIPQLGRTVIQVPSGQEDTILNQLSKDSYIENAEPNYIYHVLFTPNDPFLSRQWDLTTIKAQQAWDVSRGTGVKVGVSDTGIDLTHPEFAGKVVAQQVFVTNSINDVFGHGTFVAGLIAAATNNGQGIAGVCPDCQLIIAKTMNDQGSGSLDTIAQGVVWITDQGAKVINLSEGGSNPTQTMTDAINYAQGKNVVIVSAAGNNSSSQKFYPAATNTNVISVAATDSNDRLGSFSSFGTWVQMAAPGVNILSTVPLAGSTLGQNFNTESGTSMSSPITAGVAALVWTTQYGASATSVIQRLCSTADKIPGTGTNWQCGRVNAFAAVGAVVSPTTTPAPLSSTPQPSFAVTNTPTPPAPTFVCLGSCITPAPTTNAPTPTVFGLSGTPIQTSQPVPSTTDGTSISPFPTNQIISGIPSRSPSPQPSNGGGFLGFLRFILNLLMLLLKLLAGLRNLFP